MDWNNYEFDNEPPPPENGAVVEEASSADFFEHPKEARTKEFLRMFRDGGKGEE